MSYKVLYRKYRPDDFENIVGQSYIIKTLTNSIINKNISHAYIFSGPRGTGKTTTAKVFSKAINCSLSLNGTPCGKCEFCLNFQENPDIIEIDAASNNGVDEIRNLIDNIKLTPTNGRYKVYIIDEVHMLTQSAFNALLLTLEEPPKHAVFILATTNIENVPITILSRCQRFDFQKIKVDDIVLRLKEICNNESIDIDDDALTEIAYLSEGGLRDALSLLDQLSKSSSKITLELVENQIRTISQKNVNDILDCVERNDVGTFLTYINDYRVRAIDYKSLIKKLIDVASKNAKNIKSTGNYSRISFSMYKKMIIDLNECLTKININVDPYIILEMLLLDYFDTKSIQNNEVQAEKKEITHNTLIQEQKTVEQKIENPEVEFDYSNLIDLRINNCFVNAQKVFLEELKKLLDEFVNSLQISGKVKSILLDSAVVASSDKYAIFTCSSEHLVKSANKILKEIEKEFNLVTNKDLKIIFITESRWNLEKQNYIDNLKNNKKYEFIPEEENNNSEDIEINDVFNIDKVEII